MPGRPGSRSRRWQIQQEWIGIFAGQGAPMAVHTVLVSGDASGSPPKPDAARAKGAPGKLIAGGRRDVVRVVTPGTLTEDNRRHEQHCQCRDL